MIRDHFRANQQLAEIARQRGIAVPMKLLPEHQMLMDQFEGGPAETMDERYHDIQLKAHHDSVDVFENCARTCDDPRLRRFAAKKLPKLRQHFQAAQRAHRRQTAGG
jgi:putative membrane protein